MKIKKLILAVSALGAAASAGAADFNFSGNIATNNDVIEIAFSLAADATDVKVWTDSFQNATNFDPITAVWRQVGSDYTVVGQNDDNASIAPGQTYYDSGLVFPSLTAGNYLFTIAAFSNFANGSLLSQGFGGNGTTVPLANWCQPASHCNMGTYYDVHLSGIDQARNITPSVPEPETYAMLMAGLSIVGAIARRRKAQKA